MRVIVVNGELCREILHEDNFFTLCIICENKEMCGDCGLFNIKFFKKIETALFANIAYMIRLNVHLLVNQLLLNVQKI